MVHFPGGSVTMERHCDARNDGSNYTIVNQAVSCGKQKVISTALISGQIANRWHVQTRRRRR
ncbi:hypothetical protein EON65_50285 [archaeon]|nr:MAG: hypothetical protein EON65_50285 [archaeon]